MRIYAVAPVGSDNLRKLCKARFEFSASGLVDRGDGYAIVHRIVRENVAPQIIECLTKHQITAWEGRF
jgi:hypothetical protein